MGAEDIEQKKDSELEKEDRPKTEFSEAISQEGLETLRREKESKGLELLDNFSSDGGKFIESANNSIGVSHEKFQQLKDSTGVKKSEARLEESAKGAYERLKGELDEMFKSGNSKPEEIKQKMDEIEETHRNVLAEKRADHERKMKELEDLSSSNENLQEAQENMERQIFKGKTLEEAKRDAGEFLKNLEKKQQDFIESQRGEKQLTVEEAKRQLEEMKKRDEEKINNMLKEMEENAKRLIEETRRGVGDAVNGEKQIVKVCAKCGREEFNMSANFCAGCGTKLEGEKTGACSRCGRENPMGSRFCGSCGNKL